MPTQTRRLRSISSSGRPVTGCGWGQRRCVGPYSGPTDRLKKTLRAQERDEGERLLFQDVASTVEVKRLVVIDESGSKVGMTPAYSRAPSGERAYSTAPFNSGQNYTLLAALRLSGMSAPLVIEGAADEALHRPQELHSAAGADRPHGR